jgi:sugar lactone lactonase YvrE
MKTCLLFISVFGLVATACGADDGPAVGTIEEFAFVGSGNEGLAFVSDSSGAAALYVSQVNVGLVRVDVDGTVTNFATVPSPVGVTARSDGALLVCGRNQADDESLIWLVDSSGEATVLVDGGTAPLAGTNFVVIAPSGELVFSDHVDNVVYVADADGGNLAPITSSITYPNGLAFSDDGAVLYVASWDTSTLWAIPRDTATGEFGAPEAYLEGIEDIDGVVALAGGELLLVSSTAGVVRVAADKSTEVLAPGDDFRLPANAAIGAGEFDSQWLYVTNLFGTTVDRLRL